MISAVFFDLYGTLVGFTPSRHQIQAEACADFNIKVTHDGIRIGYSNADALMAKQNSVKPLRELNDSERRLFFAEYERQILAGAEVDVSIEQALRIWERIQKIPYKMEVFEDVLPVMQSLKKQGLTLALISNMNRDGNELIESMGLTNYVHFAVTSKDVGSEKPHAPIFLAALRKAKVDPSKAIHVGDQLTSDVQGASAVGIAPVLLDRDINHPSHDSCPRIESLKELPNLIISLF